MHQDIMRVSRSLENTWNVKGGSTRSQGPSFRVKSHAVAYARAMSWSSRVTLFVDDDCGTPVRQTRESLTYPVHLD